MADRNKISELVAWGVSNDPFGSMRCRAAALITTSRVMVDTNGSSALRAYDVVIDRLSRERLNLEKINAERETGRDTQCSGQPV